MSFVPITSLLGGVPGSGFLSHAINLYLRCESHSTVIFIAQNGFFCVKYRIKGFMKYPRKYLHRFLSIVGLVLIFRCSERLFTWGLTIDSFSCCFDLPNDFSYWSTVIKDKPWLRVLTLPYCQWRLQWFDR